MSLGGDVECRGRFICPFACCGVLPKTRRRRSCAVLGGVLGCAESSGARDGPLADMLRRCCAKFDVPKLPIGFIPSEGEVCMGWDTGFNGPL
jgi:hypothetical protein